MPAASITPRTGPTSISVAVEPPQPRRGGQRFVDACACGALVFAVFPFPRTGHVDHSDHRSQRSRSRALPEGDGDVRSEEHTSALQSLLCTSYAVFCLKK